MEGLVEDLRELVECDSSLGSSYLKIVQLASLMAKRRLEEMGSSVEIEVLTSELDHEGVERHIRDLISRGEILSSGDPMRILERVNLVPPLEDLESGFCTSLLIVRVNGGGSIVLHSHLDTLVRGEALVGENRVYGPGAADGKGGFVAAIYGLRKAAEEEEPRATLLATVEEERGGILGLSYFSRTISWRGYEACLSLTGYMNRLVVGNLGVAWFSLSMEKFPPRRIRELLGSFEEGYAKPRELLSEGSRMVVQIIYFSEKPREFLEHIASELGTDEYVGFPPRISHRRRFVGLMTQMLGWRRKLGISLPSDLRFFISAGLESVAWGPMRRGNLIHSPNEFVEVPDLVECSRLVGDLILAYIGVRRAE